VAKESALKMQRNSWLRNMGVQGDTRYGNADAFSTNTNGVANTLSNITTKQWNYSVGVYFKIPVFDVVSRKSLINQSNAELEQSKTMVEVQQDEIRQLVIKQYEELLLKQRLLKIRSQSMGSATVNMEMVEREFKNGIIPVTEYVRISDIVTKAQTDYETSKTDFFSAKKILEDIVGFTFSNTNTKRKP
jgi:outer membrane protein TolC